MDQLEDRSRNWLAILIALTLGVALIFLIIKKVSD